MSFRRTAIRPLAWTAALLLAAGVLTGAILTVLPARAATIGQLQRRISAGQGRASSLSGAVHAAGARVAALSTSIDVLRRRIAAIQADLTAKRLALLKLRNELTASRTRLAALEAFESRAQAVLTRQLVAEYETDRPDIVSVVLEAHGFRDLLERLAFARRIRDQDARIVAAVRASRRAVAAQATRLGALEVRQQQLTQAVLAQRNRLAGAEVSLVSQQLAAARTRRAKAGQLAAVRAEIGALRRRLGALQAAAAARAAAAAAAASSSSGSSGSGSSDSGAGGSAGSVGAGQVTSGGGFTFPLPRGAASPPGTWSQDQGVDISAPGDTPELAVCSGTVVLHGIGGFGPWAPVLHCDSPIDGYSYVYYGHAGPADQLAVGTHVGAGQVMSSIGPGIVGISTGPHLEIGFADSSGTPNSGGAGTMMSLLHSSYGG
jgi:peptidoglycan hydrolase CwlO-like protein